MSDNKIRVGCKQQRVSASGRVLSYFVEMSHEGFNENKVISSPDGIYLIIKVALAHPAARGLSDNYLR